MKHAEQNKVNSYLVLLGAAALFQLLVVGVELFFPNQKTSWLTVMLFGINSVLLSALFLRSLSRTRQNKSEGL